MAENTTAAEKVSSQPRRHGAWWKFHWTFWTIILLLVAARLAMPYAIKTYVNGQLGRLSDYSGRLEGIRVHLWRGAYEIRELNVAKKKGGAPVPFFSSASIDLSLQWRELFHGSV